RAATSCRCRRRPEALHDRLAVGRNRFIAAFLPRTGPAPSTEACLRHGALNRLRPTTPSLHPRAAPRPGKEKPCPILKRKPLGRRAPVAPTSRSCYISTVTT